MSLTDWLNPVAQLSQGLGAFGLPGIPGASPSIPSFPGVPPIPGITQGTHFWASENNPMNTTVGGWDQASPGQVMSPAGMNYDPNIAGSGQFTGPGGNPNWNPYTRTSTLAGLGAYTRPSAQVGHMPTAGYALPSLPSASAPVAQPRGIGEPAQHGTLMGQWGGGLGSGPLGRQWEVSTNRGSTWNTSGNRNDTQGTNPSWGQQGAGPFWQRSY